MTEVDELGHRFCDDLCAGDSWASGVVDCDRVEHDADDEVEFCCFCGEELDA